MTDVTLVRDLAVVLAISGAVTAAFHRLRQPVVLGYILAGVLIGPHTPPFALVRDAHSIETLAELGVILLLFSIGLEFSLRKLRRVGVVAVIGAGLEIPLMIWLGYSVGRLVGWGPMDSLFLGAILSVSSTTIIAKALMELGLTREHFARVIMGILIVEDLAAIAILVVLSGLASAGTVALRDVGTALGGVVLFVTALTIVGLLTVPRLLNILARIPAREVLTISVTGLCFGAAILADALGFSVALGAFLIGAVIAESRHVHEIEERIESVRDIFSAIFFVAVGLQIDPSILVEYWPLVLALSVLTVLGKAATCSLGALVAGYPPRVAFRVGMGLGQIGEFSFIIASLGRDAGVISDFLYPITVAVSAVTTLTTPYQIRWADPVGKRLGAFVPRAVSDFFAFYDRQLARARRGSRWWRLEDDARLPLIRLLLSVILLGALVVAAAWAADFVKERGIGPLFFAHDLEILVWSVCGVLSFPVLAGLWRYAGEIAGGLARRLAGGGSGNRVLAETFRLILVIVGAAVFLAAASPVLPSRVPLVASLGIVALAALLFRRSVRGAQERAEDTLRRLFATPAGEAGVAHVEATTHLTRLVSTKYPFDVVLEDVILPFTPSAVHRPIRDLALRSRTGATIAAIYRGEEVIVNPDPSAELLPGDVLLLLGSTDQIRAAMAEIERLASAPNAPGKP
ncbi:MAG: cation:proton antiporter [Candidatus Binatia bacterium]